MKAMAIAPLSGKQQSPVRRERAEPGGGGGCPTAPAGLSVQERGSEPTTRRASRLFWEVLEI